MGNKADRRRRLIGVVFLGAALVMLLAGETVLRDSFDKTGFLVYWLACFAFTFLAILVAFLDLAIVRRRTRQEQRSLLEDTLVEIAREKEARKGNPSRTDDSR